MVLCVCGISSVNIDCTAGIEYSEGLFQLTTVDSNFFCGDIESSKVEFDMCPNIQWDSTHI